MWSIEEGYSRKLQLGHKLTIAMLPVVEIRLERKYRTERLDNLADLLHKRVSGRAGGCLAVLYDFRQRFI